MFILSNISNVTASKVVHYSTRVRRDDLFEYIFVTDDAKITVIVKPEYTPCDDSKAITAYLMNEMHPDRDNSILHLLIHTLNMYSDITITDENILDIIEDCQIEPFEIGYSLYTFARLTIENEEDAQPLLQSVLYFVTKSKLIEYLDSMYTIQLMEEELTTYRLNGYDTPHLVLHKDSNGCPLTFHVYPTLSVQ